MSARINKSIMEWNMGLSSQDLSALKTQVAKETAKELQMDPKEVIKTLHQSEKYSFDTSNISIFIKNRLVTIFQ